MKTTRNAFNTDWNDAGELREYLAEKYARVMTVGGTPDQMRRAMGIARRISRMTGLPIQEVVTTVQHDVLAA
jgi:hypothetical protein